MRTATITRGKAERYRIYATITRGGAVQSTGENSFENDNTSRFRQKWPNSIHAEEAAILAFLRTKPVALLKNATMHVSRVTREGAFGMARPCEHCMELLQKFGFKKVIFTNQSGTYTTLKLRKT